MIQRLVWVPLLAVFLSGCGSGKALTPRTIEIRDFAEQRLRGAIVASPCVTSDRIFLNCIIDEGPNSRGRIACLDRTTLRELWGFDHDGKMLHSFSTPAFHEGKIYFGEGMHGNLACVFYCVDAQSGKLVWHARTRGHIESSPVLFDGKVYVCSGDDGLYCWDASMGSELWHFDGGVHLDSNPCIDSGMVFVGAGISKKLDKTAVIALHAESGKVVWRTLTTLPAWGSPIVDGANVYVGLGNGRLDRSVEPPLRRAGAILSLDRATGAEGWQFPVGDGVLASPSFDNDSIFFGSRDSHVYCVDKKSHQLRWKAAFASAVVTTPLLGENCLYVAASAGQIVSVDKKNGMSIAMLDLGQHTRSSAVLYATPILRCGGAVGCELFVTCALRNPVSSAAGLFVLVDRS